jgi:hypothetical protein
LRPLHMLERAIAIRDNGDQTFAILVGRKDADGLCHADRLAYPSAPVNPQTESVHYASLLRRSAPCSRARPPEQSCAAANAIARTRTGVLLECVSQKLDCPLPSTFSDTAIAVGPVAEVVGIGLA